MASTNSFPFLARDWEGLMAACLEHPEIAELTGDLRAELQTVLSSGRLVANRKTSLRGQRQRATQELNQLIQQGKELARRIRRVTPFFFGTNNEVLVQFNVAPLRKRSASADKPPLPPPVELTAEPGTATEDSKG